MHWTHQEAGLYVASVMLDLDQFIAHHLQRYQP
jgi:hypothetical protein